MKLWQQVALGLVLGIIFGAFLPSHVSYVKPVGEVFLRLIRLVIPILIFFSLVSGITSVKEPAAVGRLAIKSFMIFLATTVFAVIFGLGFGIFFEPGKGVILNQEYHQLLQQYPSSEQNNFNFTQFLLNMVPDNPLLCVLESNVLQIVFFAVFVGVAINKLGPSSQRLRDMSSDINRLVMKLIDMIVWLSPYASFALIAWVVGTQGLEILAALSRLVVVVAAAMVCQYLLFGLMILLFCRVSPMPFYRKSVEYQVIALATSSSKATLATTMNVAEHKLGISKICSNFTLPLGAAINMSGLTINLGLAVIFFAQILGIELELYQYLILICTITLGSIGGAGIPGASLIMLPMILSSIDLPIEGVALVAGIDRILDMLRTTISITGDVATTMVIDNSEGTFDKAKYYSSAP